ncbi:hypothetical protein TELCIR_04222 [Teladorsagia circumcincta]|uniref:Uncharacterized protein n=1 Tax=Teladorsagia circumcincta TaxID=45464 RepID=A0A2G9UUF9_TELCI|nr:hypothetical protein TELCIR_04222 [Teladorsagia circumcincta]
MRCRGDEKRQRCVFTLSDQLVLTSVRRKNPTRNAKLITQSADFLDSNRFKLIIKIALDDVEIAKDTLSILQETEQTIDVVREDEKVIRKVIELANLIKGNKEKLMAVLDEMVCENSVRLRTLNDQMTSNPELTTVHLAVATSNGVETVPLEFGSAEKRAVWETAFREAKTALINQQISAPPAQIKSVIAHQTRAGLQLCAATVVPGKRPDSAPYIWLFASDKFSGQVAVVSLENGDPCIESCAGIGNAAVTAASTVPPPPRSGESSESDEETSSGQTTVWIGNDDGEVFVVNSTERVRTRARERVARLPYPVTAIACAAGYVYVATASPTKVQLLRFYTSGGTLSNFLAILKPFKDGSLYIPIKGRVIRTLAKRWSMGAGIADQRGSFLTSSYSGDVPGGQTTNAHKWPPVACHGYRRNVMGGREDIIREHKMGCLRISCITVATSQLWIGTSAGFVISTPVHCAKTQPIPPLSSELKTVLIGLE